MPPNAERIAERRHEALDFCVAAVDELLVLSSAVHGASRDAASRLMRLARARVAARARGVSIAGRTPVTEQDWSQVRSSESMTRPKGELHVVKK